MCAFARKNMSPHNTIITPNGNNNDSKNALRTRKQRMVKNGYIEVDNVTISAGYLYSEWIRLSKQKLLERENALMKIRIDTIQSIVNKELKKHENHTSYLISGNTLSLVENAISNTIGSWNGIDLNKKISSKPYQKFRQYFNVAKNWWDQKKTCILGQSLWDPVLIELQQFVKEQCIDDENHTLLWQILNSLFDETVKYPNTKQQPLIPNGVIKNCKQVHQFFFGLNKKINIGSWLKQEIILEKKLDAKYNQVKKRTGNAKIIAQTLRKMLTQLANNDNIDNVVKDHVDNNCNNLEESRFKSFKQEPQAIMPVMTNEASSTTSTTPSISMAPLSVPLSPRISMKDQNMNNINNMNNEDELKSELKQQTAITSVMLPPINPISFQSAKTHQQTDYNSIIFALAGQFIDNNNNMTMLQPQPLSLLPVEPIQPNNIINMNNMRATSLFPVLPIQPIHGQNSRNVQNGGHYVGIVPMGYNSIHMGSYHQFTQFQVSDQRFNPLNKNNNNNNNKK